MPRLLAQMGVVPNTPMYNALYEGIEIASCLYAVESGMIDNIGSKNIQIAVVAAGFTYYDRFIVAKQ